MHKPATVDPLVHPLIRDRWSPRAFADRPLEAGHLHALFEAAQWAPSSYNEQPWVFVVARRHDETEAFARLLDCLVAANQTWARQAPVLILTAAKLAFERGGKPNRHAFHDLGLAVAQLSLQATALGLAVHQMAGIDGDKVRRTCALPAGWEPVTGLAVGHVGDPQSLPEDLRQAELGPRRRKPLTDFVFAAGWGVSPDFL